MRTKQVVISSTAGARLRTVNRSITWSVELEPVRTRPRFRPGGQSRRGLDAQGAIRRVARPHGAQQRQARQGDGGVDHQHPPAAQPICQRGGDCPDFRGAISHVVFPRRMPIAEKSVGTPPWRCRGRPAGTDRRADPLPRDRSPRSRSPRRPASPRPRAVCCRSGGGAFAACPPGAAEHLNHLVGQQRGRLRRSPFHHPGEGKEQAQSPTAQAGGHRHERLQPGGPCVDAPWAGSMWGAKEMGAADRAGGKYDVPAGPTCWAPLLACPSGAEGGHCWTSQQWHTRPVPSAHGRRVLRSGRATLRAEAFLHFLQRGRHPTVKGDALFCRLLGLPFWPREAIPAFGTPRNGG